MPRLKTNVAPREHSRITVMRSVGASRGTVAKRIGMTLRAFNKALERDKRARDAWDAGEAQLETDLVSSLYEQAMNPKDKNPTPAIFLLKSIRNFIDQPKPEATQNKVSIEFKLPGALDEASYRKLLDITPRKKLIEEGVVSDEG